MNAGLAKPIPAIWFIQARAIDLNQIACCGALPRFAFLVARSFQLHARPTKCCDAQSEDSRMIAMVTVNSGIAEFSENSDWRSFTISIDRLRNFLNSRAVTIAGFGETAATAAPVQSR
jgi:hypothetical protein